MMKCNAIKGTGESRASQGNIFTNLQRLKINSEKLLAFQKCGVGLG